MNKRDKSNADFLRNALIPLNEKADLPEELSAENIAALVSGEKQKKSKKGRIIAFRAIASAAAAIIIAAGIGTGIHFANRPAITVVPENISNATTPISDNTEQTIIDYFTALYADYEKEQYRYYVEEALDFGVKADDAEAEAPAAGTGTNGSVMADVSATGSYGKTNTQVKDVDEDDIIKNDGKYIYVLTDSSIKIIDAADMKLMSRISIDSRGSNGLYLYGNTLVAVGSTFDKRQQTEIELYDITDKANPKLINEFSQDGYYFSSRLTDGRIILLSQHSVYPETINLKDKYAVYDDVVPTVTNGTQTQVLAPDMITILPQENDCSYTYTVMTTVDLNAKEFSPVTSSVLGSGDNLYCTKDNLYIVETKFIEEKADYGNGRIAISTGGLNTVIHRFSLKDSVIRAEATGEVKGRTLNQFSIDEKNNLVRIATTDDEANRITVLDMNLKKVAEIDGIATGETIQSVRYIGDYGYVVTFLQTDPLFVIDFKDMKNPKIVGELKIPGFSSYLHPFNGYLVGIGTHGDDGGALNALKISLFDISDPTNPQEVDRFIVQNAYADSYHKTVMDCAEKNILGFIYSDNYTGEAKLATLRIKEGNIEHIGSYSNGKSDESYTGAVYSPDGKSEIVLYDKAMYAGESVQRATYIGNTLYTISAHRICSYPIDGGNIIATLDF
ncbi:MAG: beta-propeller domain-containing protein [Clostridia bacterium]|nr:beta-propeller domain-containing protein [Clostridia bacterium]